MHHVKSPMGKDRGEKNLKLNFTSTFSVALKILVTVALFF